jgi:hypothetical protein
MDHGRNDYNRRIQDVGGQIPDDEPVFLLRAQDVAAADTVRYWAKLNVEGGGDKDVSDRALAHADNMEAWVIKKRADTPAEAVPSE